MADDFSGHRPLLHPGGSPLDGALAFLDLAYETAESPSRLREALALLAELVGAPSVLLLSTEAGERRLVAAAHAPSSPANESAELNVRSDRLRTIPLSHALELVVDASATRPLQEALLLRLAPHLGRALRIADRHAHDEEDDHLSLARLDRLALAVVLLDPNGQVVLLNRVARVLLGAATSIEIASHRLAVRQGVARVLFESLVERVIAPPDPDRKFVGGRLTVPDGQWGGIQLLVAPCSTRVSHSEVSAAVLLSAPGLAPPPEERLCDLFGLAPEEARVAVDIIAGRGRDEDPDREATEALVRALYRKLGTTRQADLLRLALRPPGVVFESASQRSRTL